MAATERVPESGFSPINRAAIWLSMVTTGLRLPYVILKFIWLSQIDRINIMAMKLTMKWTPVDAFIFHSSTALGIVRCVPFFYPTPVS